MTFELAEKQAETRRKAIRRDSWPAGVCIEAIGHGERVYERTYPGTASFTFEFDQSDLSATDWDPIIGWAAQGFALTAKDFS